MSIAEEAQETASNVPPLEKLLTIYLETNAWFEAIPILEANPIEKFISLAINKAIERGLAFEAQKIAGFRTPPGLTTQEVEELIPQAIANSQIAMLSELVGLRNLATLTDEEFTMLMRNCSSYFYDLRRAYRAFGPEQKLAKATLEMALATQLARDDIRDHFNIGDILKALDRELTTPESDVLMTTLIQKNDPKRTADALEIARPSQRVLDQALEQLIAGEQLFVAQKYAKDASRATADKIAEALLANRRTNSVLEMLGSGIYFSPAIIKQLIENLTQVCDLKKMQKAAQFRNPPGLTALDISALTTQIIDKDWLYEDLLNELAPLITEKQASQLLPACKDSLSLAQKVAGMRGKPLTNEELEAILSKASE